MLLKKRSTDNLRKERAENRPDYDTKTAASNFRDTEDIQEALQIVVWLM